MILTPIAHAGHWLEGALYLAPVVILAVVLFVQGRKDDGEDRRRRPTPTALASRPRPAARRMSCASPSGVSCVDREADPLAPALVDEQHVGRVLEGLALRAGCRRPSQTGCERGAVAEQEAHAVVAEAAA